MGLPKLNSEPKYEMTIPSTQRKVRFRPYLVKEEKVLLLANETQDTKTIMDSVVDTIAACVEGDFSKEQLTTFDVEYMFAKVRSKSVGETADIMLKCSKCEVFNDVKIKLDDLEIIMPDVQTKITLTDDISMKMRWPRYVDISQDSELIGNLTSETSAFKVLEHCIESIMTEDEIWNTSDQTAEEIQAFVNSMNRIQIDKVKDFIDAIPQIEKEVDFICTGCEHENKTLLKGSEDFF
jgi:hypothetical protein